MSPLVKHYIAIKAKYPDAVLLFRAGDFYETFDGDAEIIARHLGVTLTVTENNAEIRAHVSLSHDLLDKALHKLVKEGHLLAV